jgi:Tol biopolymer transport system component
LCFLCILLVIIFCARKDDFEKGINALKKGDYAKAIKSLNVALVKDSLNAELRYNLSLAYAHSDSVQKSFYYYLKTAELDSHFVKDVHLKELLAHFLKIEPYPSQIIPMKRMNRFKGVISPDGKMIAVAAARRDRPDIYLLKPDGTTIRRVTKSGENTDPAFSPSGEHIIFVSNVDGDEELYLYDLKTKHAEKLTNNSAQDFSPSFSPDGKDVVFVSNMDDPYKWEIYKINVKNKKIKRLTKNKYWDGFPKFTSDGKSIVFSSKRNGSENIYMMKKNGGGEKLLYQSSADDNDPTLIGEHLFFKSNCDGEWEIYQLHLKSKFLMRLTNNKYPDWNPRVSKDGSQILLARKVKKRWRLYRINFKKPVDTEFLIAKIKSAVKLENKK